MKKIKLFNGTFNIYTMNINKVFADGYACKRDGIGATSKTMVVQEDAEFYRTHSIFGTRYVNIDNDTVLLTEEEANDYMNGVADKRMHQYLDIATDLYGTEEERIAFLNKLEKDSACIYPDMKTLKFKEEITKDELKQKIKERKRNK